MKVLRPITIGPVELSNRIATTAHTTLFADSDGYPSRRLADYQHARARGGVGLIISSGVRVRPASDIPNRLSASQDGCIPRFAELAERIRSEGSRFIVQLSETGRVHGTSGNPPIAPSPIPWRPYAPVPHQLTETEAAGIVDDFARAAHRIAKAGADGIEVQLAHGTLLQQFLSPASNHRHDRYGGSVHARMQLPLEVLHAVKAHLAPGMALCMRISADEFVDGGLHVEDMLEIVVALTNEVTIDLLDVSHSAYVGQGDSLTTQVADMYYPPAPFADFGKTFRDAFPGLPILTGCRVGTLERAEELLDRGAADLVGMTRAHIADPDLVRKHVNGHSETVRQCVACNQGCLGNLERGQPITCVVNPGVGFEGEGDRYLQIASRVRPHVAETTSSPLVLVAGAGPAGLEAAIECRLAGLRVLIVEQRAEAGGQLRHASLIRGRELWGRVFEDQVRIADSLGVEFEYGTPCTAAKVAEARPVSVIVATGSHESTVEARDGSPRHLGLDDAIATLDDLRLEHSVVVVDELGAWPAASLAYDLSAAGAEVHFVTPEDRFAPHITLYSKLGLLDRLATTRMQTHLMRRLEWDGATRLQLRDVLSQRCEPLDGIGAVVTVRSRLASDGLARELADAGYTGAVHVIGDARAPRSVLEAIADGRSAAQTASTRRSAAVELRPRCFERRKDE